MNAHELCLLTISELSSRIRKKEVSPVEVTRATLDRIEQLDTRLNSYITVTREAALAAAQAAETAIQAGNYRGPLHGVPLAVKDIFATKGVKTTCGAKILADNITDYDATVIERLHAAGVILVGKLNMHEFACGPTTDNPHYGPTRNPWNVERIPGGSSGGSGTAVAASLCSGSLGTDTGGSIRIPAALCGIVGLKPTYGQVSRFGVTPLSWSLDHIGPLVKSVEDAAVMLRVIAGRDPRDPTTSERPVPDYTAALTGEIKGVRVGVPWAYIADTTDSEVHAAFARALQDLERLGAIVEEITVPYLQYAPVALLAIVLPEAAAYHEKNLASRAQDYGADVRTLLQLGKLLPAHRYVTAQRLRGLLMQDLARCFERVEVVCTPTVAVPAFPIGAREVMIRGKAVDALGALTRFTGPFNLAGLPALSLPGGFSADGLPIGLQIVGRPFGEPTVLRVGYAYEQHTPWHGRQPQL